MKKPKKNIYLFSIGGEIFWICADTTIEALMHFIEEEDYFNEQFDKEDDIQLLPRYEWEKRNIKYKDPEEFEVSFEEFMQTATEVQIFASTIND